MLFALLAVLVAQTPATDGAKILAVYTFPGKSHYMMHRVLISELLKHGHEVCTDIYTYIIIYILYKISIKYCYLSFNCCSSGHHDNGTNAGTRKNGQQLHGDTHRAGL